MKEKIESSNKKKRHNKRVPLFISVICLIFIILLILIGTIFVVNRYKESKDDQGKEENIVNIDGVKWEILDSGFLGATLESNYGNNCVSKEGSFFFVKVNIENKRKDVININEIKLHYRYKYEEETGLYEVNSVQFPVNDRQNVDRCVNDVWNGITFLNPGASRAIVFVYDIPEDAFNFQLEATDFDFEYIDLEEE